MKILFHSEVAAPSLIRRYQFAQQRLHEAGIDSEIRTGAEICAVTGQADVIVSHNWIPEEVRQLPLVRCFGGKPMTRPESLTLLASLGFPTMQWTTVPDLESALALFGSWDVDKLILKRSFTGGGHGFHVLTPNQPRYTTWNFERDVICKEVNPHCGRVYKAELFGGKLMLGFVLKKEPLGCRLCPDDECLNGCRELLTYREATERPDERHRELWEFSAMETGALEGLSAALTRQGFGYVSVDLMRRPDGELVAIELNTGSVTSWWSEQFPVVRERFADALLKLVQQS